MGGLVLLALGGCGQTGALYLPTEPAAAHRATLPQSLWPVMPERRREAGTPPPPPPDDSAPASDTPTTPASQ
jgi:predicted small lipoprotein YifL